MSELWFGEIRRAYPSAEAFVLPVVNRSLLAVVPLMGCVNSDWFIGRGPGSLLLIGPHLDEGRPVAMLRFAYRREGWNTEWSPEDNRYVNATYADGRPLYRSADFGAVIQAPGEMRQCLGRC